MGELIPGVRSIAILRGGGIGDVILVMPAVHALAAAYPDAELTLYTRATPARIVAGRLPFALQLVELPRHPGVEDAPDAPDVELDEYFAAQRLHGFDLAVQLHGGGRHSNPFLARLGAAHTVGAATPDAPPLERTLPYQYYQHEALRALETAALAGAKPVELEARLSTLPSDRAAAQAELGIAATSSASAPLVVLHPGATDPRRRWPRESFVRLAAALEAWGAHVLVLDRELETPALVGLLASASLVIGNDSGPRHLAQALGTPTVGIYWIGNMINASALSRARHRTVISWTTACPVCGRDQSQPGWTAPRCEHDVSFVAEVPVEAVLVEALELLGA